MFPHSAQVFTYQRLLGWCRQVAVEGELWMFTLSCVAGAGAIWPLEAAACCLVPG